MQKVYLLVISFCLFLTACEDPSANKTKATTAEPKTAANTTAGKPAGTGISLPISPENSKIEFTGSKVTGSHEGGFKKFSGTIDLVGEKPESSSVNVDIETASIYANVDQLTQHLKTPDFFDVEKFPKIEFRSTSIRRGKDRDSLDLEGDLTIRDKTVPVALAVNEMDRSRSPNGEEFVYYSATAELDRSAFGINYGRGFIGRRAQVTINVQACDSSRVRRGK